MTTTNQPKPFWQSKLMWLGVLQILVGFLTLLQSDIQSGVSITTFGVLTLLLRSVTTTVITFDPQTITGSKKIK